MTRELVPRRVFSPSSLSWIAGRRLRRGLWPERRLPSPPLGRGVWAVLGSSGLGPSLGYNKGPRELLFRASRLLVSELEFFPFPSQLPGACPPGEVTTWVSTRESQPRPGGSQAELPEVDPWWGMGPDQGLVEVGFPTGRAGGMAGIEAGCDQWGLPLLGWAWTPP